MGYTLILGDVRNTLEQINDKSVQCVITSPPYYGLRDYSVDGQIGLEQTPEEYIENLVNVFQKIKRVIKNDGTLWINIGDTYVVNNRKTEKIQQITGLRPKNLIGIPWRVAFALQKDGWYLRQDIIWNKPNPMPESVKDRCTRAHEYIFLLTKSSKYYYNHTSIMEPASMNSGYSIQRISGNPFISKNKSGFIKDASSGKGPERFIDNGKRNKRSVWTVNTKPYKEAHFATFPMKLIEPCVLAGTKEGDTILDPFNGSGTTGVVALKNNRNYVGCELNSEYINLSEKRFLNELY